LRFSLNRALGPADVCRVRTLPPILVVDNDPLVREVLGEALRHDFEVRFATSGEAALAALLVDPPVAMLLDFDLADGDGYQVLEERRRRRLAPTTRVVMLSARDDERAVVRSWVLGADSHLAKPIDPDHISAWLRTLLEAGVPARTPSRA